MRKKTMSAAVVQVSALFLLGIAVAYAARSNFGPAMGPFITLRSLNENAGRCPITHTTVLVQIFGDALCPVAIREPTPIAP
jgi:hypothetical protein